MKKIIFETIRTTFFISTIIAALIFLGVAVNEVWTINLKWAPVLPEVIPQAKILKAFNITGALALITMPMVLFGMACRAYSERQTVKDGEEIVKISMPFVLMLVVLPTILFMWQGKWEQLMYFAIYWLVVVMVGRLGKSVPMTPLLVICLDRRIKRPNKTE